MNLEDIATMAEKIKNKSTLALVITRKITSKNSRSSRARLFLMEWPQVNEFQLNTEATDICSTDAHRMVENFNVLSQRRDTPSYYNQRIRI